MLRRIDDHPIRVTLDDDLRRSRLTVFFRLLLAIPHLIWIALWTIAVFFAAIAGWVAALFTGLLPSGLHRFLSAYVRYAAHLAGYLSLAVNPYPGFTGEPGYPLDVVIPERQPQPRWKIALRLLLAIPALLLAAMLGSGFGGGEFGGSGYSPEAVGDSRPTFQWFASTGVGGVAALCGFLGWFVSLARGRMTVGLRNLATYGVGYTAQTNAYALLLTDRYPNTDPDKLGPVWELPPHPLRLELSDDGSRSRLTVFFRLLLAIPHFVWVYLWSIAAFFAAILNWFFALFAGRSAGPLHRFLAAYVRYYAHLTAFIFVVANPFPGFSGAPGYPVDIVIDPPERQNRWITFFRGVLSIPALIVSIGLTFVLFVVGTLGWFAALATGRMPTGFRSLGAACVRYLAQTNAYWYVLTDEYPHASPALRPPAAAEPEYELVPEYELMPEPEPDEPEAV